MYSLKLYFEAIQMGHYKDHIGIVHCVVPMTKIRMQNYICATCPTLWENMIFWKRQERIEIEDL